MFFRKFLCLSIFITGECLATGFSELDIDLDDCKPDGVLSGISESIDASSFWARQHVAIEMILQAPEYRPAQFISECKFQYPNDKSDQMSCMLFYQNRHENLLKCLKSTKLMCRANGGSC